MVNEPVLVVGSTQPVSTIDRHAARRAGVTVARRRSGGGAVLLTPDDPVWTDVWLPRNDPLFEDDVRHSPLWLGTLWAEALSELGAREVAVHRGGGRGHGWDAWVCFAGVGPGEVTSEGRKVVGISQWRAREGALFHVAAYRHWDPSLLTAILRDPQSGLAPPAGRFDAVAIGVGDLIGPGSTYTGPSDEAAGNESRFDPAQAVIDVLVARLPEGSWEVRTDRS